MRSPLDDEALRRRIQALDSLDAPGEYTRRPQRIAKSRRAIYRRIGLSLLSAAAIGSVILIVAVVAAPDHQGSTRTGHLDPWSANGLLTSGPCGGLGTPSSLGQLTPATQPFTPYLPSDALTDLSSVKVWKCEGTEVELVFASGVTIYMDVNKIANPRASWESLAKQDPQDTSVGSVHGQPAALIDPAKSTGGANGSVSLVLGGTWIVVEGNGSIPLSDLVRITESLSS